MPYAVRKGSGDRPYKIVKSDTGEVVGSSVTRGKAMASMRARYAAENGATMGKPKKKSK